jgi:hypothetical protein
MISLRNANPVLLGSSSLEFQVRVALEFQDEIDFVFRASSFLEPAVRDAPEMG